MARTPISETDDQQEAAELFAEIEAQEQEIWKLTLAVNTAKIALKEAKEAEDAGIARLRALARTRLENPLFNQESSEPED